MRDGSAGPAARIPREKEKSKIKTTHASGGSLDAIVLVTCGDTMIYKFRVAVCVVYGAYSGEGETVCF